MLFFPNVFKIYLVLGGPNPLLQKIQNTKLAASDFSLSTVVESFGMIFFFLKFS